MLQYTIKRLLLIPPTFFFVSLVIFVVLNIAPGRPGAADAAQSGEQSNSANQRESYRIFKEQFNLDKPILFNTRFGLEKSDVRRLIVNAHNLTGDVSPADRLEAQEDLDDFGNYMVRHLIVIADSDSDVLVQQLASMYLTQAAQISFLRDRGGDDGGEVRIQNRAIGKENEAIKNWWWKADATVDEINQVKAKWADWWELKRERFEYTSGEKVGIFFFDTRFAKYWTNLATLDFGVSTVDRRAVLPTIISKLKYSLSLTLVSVILAYLISVPIGIYSAVNQNSTSDMVISVCLFLFYSLPTFFLGTVLLMLFSEGEPFAWFPTGGFESADDIERTTLERIGDVAWHLTLPLIAYTIGSLAALSRYARTGVIDVIRADYIRTARAKGLHEFVVIVKHAVRNGMIPILTLLGGLLPAIIGGSVVIEVIFGIPGMGLYFFDAINLRDYNAVMATLVMGSLLTLLGILVSDLSYAAADPRISFD